MTMTLQEVELRVQGIRDIAGDDEAAHGAEDLLHQEVLRSIADDECTAPRACAAAALETLKIDFARWCA